jgi:hypothetical protein
MEQISTSRRGWDIGQVSFSSQVFRRVALVTQSRCAAVLRDPPMPEAALGLSPQTCLDLAQPQPSRKVLSNVLWFRLARLSLQTGHLPFLDILTDSCLYEAPPRLIEGKGASRSPNNCPPLSYYAAYTWLVPGGFPGETPRVKFGCPASQLPRQCWVF